MTMNTKHEATESVQERNKRMGWGCKCHGETFCPDLVCIGMEDDVPIFVRKDSEEAKQWLLSRMYQRMK